MIDDVAAGERANVHREEASLKHERNQTRDAASSPMIWDPLGEWNQPTWAGQLLRDLPKQAGESIRVERRGTFPWDRALRQAWRTPGRPWFLTSLPGPGMALGLRWLHKRWPMTVLLGQWPQPRLRVNWPGCCGWVPHEQARKAWAQAGWPIDLLQVKPPMAAPPRRALHPSGPRLETKEAQEWILWAGRMHLHDGLREAIWAFCILHYARPQTRLLIVGDGATRTAREQFVRQSQLDPFVRWHQAADVHALLPQVRLIWSTDAQEALPLHAWIASRWGIPVLAVERQQAVLAKAVLEGTRPSHGMHYCQRVQPTEWAKASQEMLRQAESSPLPCMSPLAFALHSQ